MKRWSKFWDNWLVLFVCQTVKKFLGFKLISVKSSRAFISYPGEKQ